MDSSTVIELESDVEISTNADSKKIQSKQTGKESNGVEGDSKAKQIGPCSADMFNLIWLGVCLFCTILSFVAAQVR